ncbi:hypothetical protein GCM10010191_12830 [Actinomadura vinacea]|uniref:DUF302 domain-containing protein n=1 Tax=Actinomadura vinacea TaxID=115336 RepID=A0ABN3IL60_9ACTN
MDWTQTANAGHARASAERLSAALGTRRLDLATLKTAIVTGGQGLACGVVSRAGAAPALNVIQVCKPEHSLDVGTDLVGGRMWFVLEPGGEGVVPVDEVEAAPAKLVGILNRMTDRPAPITSHEHGRARAPKDL